MSDRYLIAHKVRGEPAFDIAMRFDKLPNRYDEDGRVLSYMHIFDILPDDFAIANGDAEDPWPVWILPTSLQRAYPWWHTELIGDQFGIALGSEWFQIPPMPPDLPDHEVDRSAPKINLIEALGIRKPKPTTEPTQPFPRRL